MASSVRFERLVIAVALALAPATLAGQDPPPHLFFAGVWTLNVEESLASSDVVKTAPTPPVSDPPPRPIGPGTPSDGAGRGPQFRDPIKDGFIPPTVGNATNPPQAPKDKGRALTTQEKLLLELTTPPTTLVVSGTADAISVAWDGRSATFTTDGREEKHRFVHGTVKTRTTWTGPRVRQELDAGHDLKLVRTLELDDQGRLIVLTRPANDQSIEFESKLVSRAGVAAGKGRKRAVYDPVAR